MPPVRLAAVAILRRTALPLLAVVVFLLPARAAQGRADDAAPIVILVSFDGWRWDYIDHADTPNLKALAARGVRSEGLIPSFPSMTFPNHYTIVTGLVPDHHGVIANTMADRSIGPEKFTMSSGTAKDGRWWGGEPIWRTAMKQGMKTASMFWPGSEAIRPDLVRAFDDKVSNGDRVRQVLDWLRLPEGERPSFITLYFSEVDHAGHDYGPLTPQLLEAASHLDQALGQLVWGVEALGLTARTSIIVVSDHGMATQSMERLIYLDDYLNPDEIEVVDWSPNVAINPTSKTPPEEIFRKLAGRHPALAVYRKSDMPAWMRYGTNSRVPEVIGVAELGWTITTHKQADSWRAAGRTLGGGHGYDPRYRDLHGLFVAAGPMIRAGFVGPEFQNIHIYDFMCRLLGLTPAPNDGDPKQTAMFFAGAR